MLFRAIYKGHIRRPYTKAIHKKATYEAMHTGLAQKSYTNDKRDEYMQ